MVTEKAKFAARLNEVLDDAGLPAIGHGRQSALSKLLDVTPQHAGKWLKGEDFPQTSKLVKLAQCLGIRSNWLLSGAGEKYAPPAQEDDLADGGDTAARPLVEGCAGLGGLLSQDAFELALAWMKLPHPQRDALRQIVNGLSRDA